jgi:glycosyltransferase involved in cell wall biosynthesis
MRLSYVLPVHNEEAILADNVARLRAVLGAHEGSRILLIENGSRDGSAALALRLAATVHPVPVLAYSLPLAGIGHAYDRGMREVLALDGADRDHWLVLSAADLPFGFSDLEHALPNLRDSAAPLLIGSKAHPQSEVHVPRQRAIATQLYRRIRRGVAGMRTGDSQGSLFVRLDLAAQLVDLIRSRDFFYSTELVFHVERMGHPVVELPVTVEPEARASTVKPVRHGAKMFMALLRTVRRWGRVPARPV